jgi:hypothetical protein
MIAETERRDHDRRATLGAASQRRVEALVAAYIHELSSRHRAEREAASYPDGRIVR